MTQLRIFTAVATLIFALLATAANAETDSPGPDGGLWYYVKSYDLSLRVPAGWQVIDRHKGTLLSMVSPPENRSDPFRENCSLAASTLTEAAALGDYAKAMQADAEKELEDYAPLENGSLTMAGQPAVWWSYSHQWRFVRARVVAFMVMRENTAFVLSCSAQPARYTDYKAPFWKLAESLHFGKVTKTPSADKPQPETTGKANGAAD